MEMAPYNAQNHRAIDTLLEYSTITHILSISILKDNTKQMQRRLMDCPKLYNAESSTANFKVTIIS